MLIKGKLAPGTPSLASRAAVPSGSSAHETNFVVGFYSPMDLQDSYQGRKDIYSNTSRLLTHSSSNVLSSSSSSAPGTPKSHEARQESAHLFCVQPFFRRQVLTNPTSVNQASGALPIPGFGFTDTQAFSFYSQGEMRGLSVGGDHPYARNDYASDIEGNKSREMPYIWIDGKDVAYGSKIDLNRILRCGQSAEQFGDCKAESVHKNYEIECITNIEMWVFGDQNKKNRIMSSIFR
jgi:hypothetical protein